MSHLLYYDPLSRIVLHIYLFYSTKMVKSNFQIIKKNKTIKSKLFYLKFNHKSIKQQELLKIILKL